MSQKTLNVVVRCKDCGWRIFNKISTTSGVIQIKCPRCKKVQEIDLSFRRKLRAFTAAND